MLSYADTFKLTGRCPAANPVPREKVLDDLRSMNAYGKKYRKHRPQPRDEQSQWSEGFQDILGSKIDKRYAEKWDAAFYSELNQLSENGEVNIKEKFRSAPNAPRYMQLAQEHATRQANMWLLNYESLRRDDIAFTDSDHDFKAWAEAKSVKCHEIVRKSSMGEAWRQCSELASKYEIPRLMLSGTEGVCYEWQLSPLLERYKDAAWWLRQIRKVALREVEKIALSLGEIHKKNQAYCSNYAVKRRLQQKARNRALLENLKAVNNEGDEYSLQELSDLNISNPVLRRHELMCRLRGFETVANLYQHSAVFVTVTCPSKYHPSSKKYNGFTPRESQAYLSKVWARVRAKLDREGVRPYGFRIAEPHKDGCPHWHILLFCHPEEVGRIVDVTKDYALAEDGREAGALANRVDVEHIDLEKGSAVGYISKYICKNIDGVFTDKAENYQSDFLEFENGNDGNSGDISVSFNCVDIDGNFIGRSDQAAIRVEAWATTWGIRQFQQIGGPSVTVWRELRRMDSEEDEYDLFGGVVERARKAADSGDWGAYCIAMGAISSPRRDHRIRSLLFVQAGVDKTTGEVILSGDCLGPTNKYGEPASGQVIGVTCLNIDYLTRFYEWETKNSKLCEVVEVSGHRDLVPDWVLRGAAPPLERSVA